MSKIQKIAAAVAGLSMVFALVAVAVPASAQTAGTTFTQTLTVGSRGDQVTALQQVLIDGGYLTAVSAPTGYFGAATKAAVAKWQAAVGITPAAGYFGVISRTYLNANTPMGGGTSMVPGCVAGGMYSSTTGAPCTSSSTVPGCAAGAMYSSTTGASCTGGTTGTSTTVWSADGSDGSLTVSSSSFVGSGTQIRKGQTGGLVAVQLQATAGKVNVNRFDVHMNIRPWLYFGSIQLKDQSGNVIATKTLSSSADATEVTIGSDYLIRFDNVNYVVIPGATKTLAVYGTVLNTTDKLTSNVSVTSWIPVDAIRTLNGKNFSDSTGLGAIGTGNAITLLGGTSSNGDIAIRISPSSPVQRIVTTNSTSQTNDVVLGVFDLKSMNTSSTINGLNFRINNSSGSSTAITSVFNNVRLVVGGQTYGAATVGTPSTSNASTTFTNLNIALAQDAWTSVQLIANVASGQTAVSASTTLFGNTTDVVGVDANYNTVTVSGSGAPTSNDTTFLLAGVTLSNAAASKGSGLSGPLVGGQSGTVGYNTTYSFTLTNSGNTDVYVAKAPGQMLATSSTASTGGATVASSTINIARASTPDTQPSDTSLAYAIPAGTSRTFTFDGVLKSPAGGGTSALKITNVYFGTSAASVATLQAFNISFGLSALDLSAGF